MSDADDNIPLLQGREYQNPEIRRPLRAEHIGHGFRIVAMRPVFEWQIGSRALQLGKRTLIMGVVNVTPDSFSDGGRNFDRDRAVEHALKLLQDGADIIDVGGESTRPGAKVAGLQLRRCGDRERRTGASDPGDIGE